MASRPQTPGASGSVANCFAASMLKMISVCNFISPHDAAKLSSALSDCSPFNENETKKIRDVIDKKVGDMSIAKSQHNNQQSQLLKHWCNYLTQTDWDILNDSRQHFSAKMTRFMERANLLGLVCTFDEKTYKWMLAVLLAVQYKETPDAHFIYAKLQELKQAKEAVTKYYPHTVSIVKIPRIPIRVGLHDVCICIPRCCRQTCVCEAARPTGNCKQNPSQIKFKAAEGKT